MGKNKRKSNKKNKKGFTLIELLIVVSIIALLSSIVVAVLTQARIGAINNRKNEMARQYINTLEFYYSEYGRFPNGGCTSCNPSTYHCLGDGYPNNTCYVFGTHQENSTVNTELSEMAPSMPAFLDAVSYNGNSYFGAAYGCINSNCKGYKLSWVLEGGGRSAQCAGGANKVTNGTLTICTQTTNYGD